MEHKGKNAREKGLDTKCWVQAVIVASLSVVKNVNLWHFLS